MDTKTAPVSSKPKTEEYELTAADRCDRCGAQAYYHVVLIENKGELYFCRHDFLKHEEAMLPLIGDLNDESKRLTEENRLKGNVNS